jgi:hypothetical protein
MVQDRKIHMLMHGPALYEDPKSDEVIERVDLANVFEDVEPLQRMERRVAADVIPVVSRKRKIDRNADATPLDAFIALRSKRREMPVPLPLEKTSSSAPTVQRSESPPLEPTNRPTTSISVIHNVNSPLFDREIIRSLTNDFSIVLVPRELPDSDPTLMIQNTALIILPLFQLSQLGVLASMRIACLRSFLTCARVIVILHVDGVNPFTRPIEEGVAGLVQWLGEVRSYVQRECSYGVWYAGSSMEVAWITRMICEKGVQGVEDEPGLCEEILMQVPGVSCLDAVDIVNESQGLGGLFKRIGESDDVVAREFLKGALCN